ncbi:MAG: ATP-binding protein [Armatimonadota bacterium]|nr:ATP-binding protein [Armatimonadota bacterium]
MSADPIAADLKTVLRRLKLSRLLDTLPERLLLARQQKLPHQDFLLLVLTDEVTRRDGLAATLRAERAGLDPAAQLEHWDSTAKVTFDRALLNELATLRFLGLVAK